MEQKVADFISAEGLLRPAEKVLLAVSGGADSTALLHVMAVLRTEGVLPVEICCAHINHQLRGVEAQRDQDFVVSECGKLKLPIFIKQIDVKNYSRAQKLSIETAARQLRIDALIEIAARQNCNSIATAHQKDDNAETILQRLSRGTGLRGLCGIWPVKQFTGGVRFVRPLLCASRDEIIQYLNGRNLEWCIDRTNKDCAYKRNFIRHRLLPTLQKDCVDNIVEQLSELATDARRFYNLICETADAVWPDIATVAEKSVTLDSVKLSTQQPEVKIEIIRRALSRFDAGEGEITRQHYENILRLSYCDKLQLPDFIEAYRQKDLIVFSRHRAYKCRAGQAAPMSLNVPGMTEFADARIDAQVFDYDSAEFEKFRADKNNAVEWLDFEKLKLPLKVRFRRPGDKFLPLGMQEEKKLGKFLTTAKTSSTLRQKLIVVEDCEKIIWLCPVRISELVKVTSRTKKVLQLKVCSRPEEVTVRRN